jgi:hypothetical protein
MERIELGGWWRRSVGDRQTGFVMVPGSYPPVGECVLERQVQVPWPAEPGRRHFLVTEGVLASARFVLNGCNLGTAGPWTTYRFEIAPALLLQDSLLRAHVRDILESFGPIAGRRFDGGLARNLWIERRPETFVSDLAFRAELDNEFAGADCTVLIELDGEDQTEAAAVTLAESDTGRIVAQARATVAAPARFRLEHPRLWCPEAPHLYTLTAALENGDTVTEQVGVRRIEAKGQGFFLNGRRLVLKGVCRHEFTDRSGYSPSETEVRRELARIKHAGFNYVRLVHSPHAPCVCRIAAELGLLVSEEPGACFHNLADEAIYAPALECLRRVVRRDRSVPSIFAWLVYNECNPDTAYAVKAARVCRELDPPGLVSFADCSGRNDQIREMVSAADLSFYGINLYSCHAGDYNARMEIFTDRPLVFTEWGGCLAQGNPRILRGLCDDFAMHSRADQPQRVAGCSFWVWADYEEHSRSSVASVDGWTIEGLVQPDGTPKDDLLTLSSMCFDIDHPPLAPPVRVEALLAGPKRPERWQPVPLDHVAGDQSGLEAAVDRRRLEELARACPLHDPAADLLPRLGRLLVDGIEFLCRDHAARTHPLMLGPGREEAVIPVRERVAALAALGQVALEGGYPASSIWSVHHRNAERPAEFGAVAAEYVLVFEDGQHVVPLRHGLEILRANDICRSWTPEPRAPQTRPAVRAVINASYEIMRLDLWEMHLDKPRMLHEVRWRLLDRQATLVLAGLSVLPAK